MSSVLSAALTPSPIGSRVSALLLTTYDEIRHLSSQVAELERKASRAVVSPSKSRDTWRDGEGDGEGEERRREKRGGRRDELVCRASDLIHGLGMKRRDLLVLVL